MGTVGRAGGEGPLGQIRSDVKVDTRYVEAAFASKPQPLPLSKSVSAESTIETKRTPETHEMPKEARIFADLASLKGLKRSLDKVLGGLAEEPDEPPPQKMIFR